MSAFQLVIAALMFVVSLSLGAAAWRLLRGPSIPDRAVAFDLGVFPAEAIRVPDRTLQGLRCRWIYKGAHCGYVGDLATCDKTREDCRRHFEDEPLRFGGFPTSADARALRVD